jgi:hypothetical protein
MARRLVVGSIVGSFENQKSIIYPESSASENVLFRVLDSSLPWWTERDDWGRWISIKRGQMQLPFAKETFKACPEVPDRRTDAFRSQRPKLILPEAIHALGHTPPGESKKYQTCLTAM